MTLIPIVFLLSIFKSAGYVCREKTTLNSSPSNLSSGTCLHLSRLKFRKGERERERRRRTAQNESSKDQETVTNPFLALTQTFYLQNANNVSLGLVRRSLKGEYHFQAVAFLLTGRSSAEEITLTSSSPPCINTQYSGVG